MSAAYKKVGKYDVLDVIGRGGMGVIYKGVDPGIGRIVAIKMITGAFADDPELLHRFTAKRNRWATFSTPIS